MSLSLDESTIHFELNDTELITKGYYFEKNVLFSHLIEKDYKIKVDLSLNDFIPIFHHISKSKKPVRGEVEDFDKFFDYCQYIGEIELPMLVTKDSNLIQRWYMTSKDLIISEIELLILKMYIDMDNDEHKNIDFYVTHYKNDKFNNKLNEKTRGELFNSLNELVIDPILTKKIKDDIKEEKDINNYKIIKTLQTNSYNSINYAIKQLKTTFFDFPWTHENGHLFVAGGCVLKSLMQKQKNFIDSDYDIFIITRDEKVAIEMITNLYEWVKKTCYKYFIISTNNAITFVTERGDFQIILRLYHSIEQVLYGFDIDACCIGFNGEDIISTPRGILSLKRKTILAIGWRQSETMAYRCYKYSNRGFDIAIPGVTDYEFNNVKDGTNTILAKIIKRSFVRNSSDYGEVIPKNDCFEKIKERILSLMIFGLYPNINIITQDILEVYDTTKCERVGNIKKKYGMTIHSKISFVSKMSHGQITGSFKPTKEDWFSGVKW